MRQNRYFLGACYIFIGIVLWCLFVDNGDNSTIKIGETSNSKSKGSHNTMNIVLSATVSDVTNEELKPVNGFLPSTANTLEREIRKTSSILSASSSKPSDPLPTVNTIKTSQLDGNDTVPFQGCILPKEDPFDKSLKSHIDLQFNYKYRKNCKKDFEVITSLKNGKLTCSDKSLYCWGRCFRGGEVYHSKNVLDEFSPIEESTYNCEFVEVQCSKYKVMNMQSYTMLHTQVIPKNGSANLEIPAVGKQHSVFVFLLDSVATGSAERYLQRTLRYMEKSMEAVQFPYITRVGLNSRPNALALFYGKNVEPVERTAMGLGTEPSDWDWWEACKRYLDNETSIFHEFKAMGYTTLLTDDWHEAILNYPDCKGLKDSIMDHSMDPFIMQSYSKAQKANFHGNNCVHLHKKTLEYTKQLIQAYPNQPHFAWNWMTQIIHENQSGPLVLDEDMMLFLYENKEMFDESFVIFMSDHGCRGCSITETELGRMEFNNPFFSIAVPKSLRTPEILGVLRENAGKLQTHFDTRATLLDILRYQPLANYGDRKPLKMEGEKGNSFLRKQEGERSCRTLPIPFTYCLCQYPIENLDLKSDMVVEAGKAVLETANQRLTDAGLDKKCNLWKFSHVESSDGFTPFSQTGAMKIVVAASYPYKKARFVTVAYRSPNGTFTIGALDRVDRYWNRGGCVLGPLQPLCDCK